MPTSYHAEHVGSLLRPPALLAARAAHGRGEISDEELRRVEDEAALEALDLQREAGIQVFTDGEVRRATWMAGLLEQLGGVVPVEAAKAPWYREDGTPPEEETDFQLVAAQDRLYRRKAGTRIEAEFLLRHAPGQFKITMMSSSMGQLLWNPEVSKATYPTPEDLIRDLVPLQIEEIGELLDAGVTWIQLDSLGYNRVIDARFHRAIGGSADDDLEAMLDATIAIDAELVRATKQKKPDVTVGMHICRGNNRSAWMAEGGYEPIAEKLFTQVGVDRFLLEYDSERAGGFEPLRFIPKGTTVVLGLVSSKTPVLESQDDLLRRIDEASRYVDPENLAISPQCGFASTALGNLLTVDDERRKLELVVNTAQRAWG
jgi:Methionine synthase II (cobalamin-independent)